MKLQLSIIAFLLINISFAQNVDFKKKNFESTEQYEQATQALEKGDDFFFAGNFEKALPSFLDAQKLNPNNALLNFKIGACYLKNDELKKSMPYFEKAQKLDPKVDPKIDFALAQSYQANGRYVDAIESYNLYLAGLSKSKKELENDKIQKQIDICSAEVQKANSKKEEEKELAEAKKQDKPEEPKTVEEPVKKAEGKEVVPAKEAPKADPKKETVKSKPAQQEKKTEAKVAPAKKAAPKAAPVAPKQDKITYRIQVSSSSRPATSEEIKKIYSGSLKVSEVKVGNLYKYYVGDFEDKGEAMKAKSLSGVSGAFLVRFKNGKKM